jgi:hypothetical protein
VALVNRLEESHLGVACKIHVLSTVSYELHKSTSHFDIPQEKNSRQYTPSIFLTQGK